MVAIQTKYLPATDTRGSRIKAYANGNTVTISFDYALDDYARDKKAALALCEKMGWSKNIAGGATPNGYIFIFLPDGVKDWNK